jgi:hypothetical protein
MQEVRKQTFRSKIISQFFFDSYGADCIYKADFMTHIKVKHALSFESFSHFLISELVWLGNGSDSP